MVFTLKIESKTLFGNKAVDFGQLIHNCGLQFGHNNEFYILEEGATVEKGGDVLYGGKV